MRVKPASMAARSFTDGEGTRWSVWGVSPGRLLESDDSAAPGYLPREMADGWLCFDGPTGKRRLYPVPARWPELTDQELRVFCRAAEPVARARAG